MGKKLDLTGHRYGRLTAVREADTRIRTSVAWLCVCDCGEECVVSSTVLRSGGKQSCGCLYAETRPQREPDSQRSKFSGNEGLPVKISGDVSEYGAGIWLLRQGHQVFRNMCSTGPVDLIAISPEGETILVDVKRCAPSWVRKDGGISVVRASLRPSQTDMGVRILYAHFETSTYAWDYEEFCALLEASHLNKIEREMHESLQL